MREFFKSNPVYLLLVVVAIASFSVGFSASNLATLLMDADSAKRFKDQQCGLDYSKQLASIIKADADRILNCERLKATCDGELAVYKRVYDD